MEKIKFEKTRAHQSYKLADGTRVPGVTTVLGVVNKPALLSWAWEQGKAGLDFRKSRDAAADVGTLAHWMIECHLKGQEPDLSEFSPKDVEKAENAVIKFLSWWDGAEFRVIGTELKLVSEINRFGGTLDIVAEDKDGNVAIIDLKTSKAIYTEHWRQVAAYADVFGQHNWRKVTRFIICRIGKSEADADFEVQERGCLDFELATFMACLALYQAIQAEKRG